MAPWWLRSRTDETAYDDEPPETESDALELLGVENDEDPTPTAPEPEATDAAPAESDPAESDPAGPLPAGPLPAGPLPAGPSRKRKRRRKRRKKARARETAPERGEETATVEVDGLAAAQAAGDEPEPAASGELEPTPSGELEPTASGELESTPSVEPEPTASDTPRKTPPAQILRDDEIVFDFGPPERSAAASDEKKIAVFCDLENIALGVRNSETKTFDINLVLERLLEKGKIIVKKAYADWERFRDYKRGFHEAAIELIDIPQKHFSGKNSADIKMVVDAMDLCYSKEHLDTFVLLSGDSDFSPLVSKLKENNKYVIGMGVKNSTSTHLIDNCDEFIFYEDVWRDLQRTPRLDHLSKRDAEVFGLLIDSILALIRENKTVIWGSMIKQTMKRKRPSFSEGHYGYSSFSGLLEDAHTKHIIRLKRDQASGNYVVTGFGPKP